MARNATFRGANLQYVPSPKSLSSLSSLSDVSIASAANLDRLQYSTSAARWVDVTALTTPQIEDSSGDHQYVFAVSELAADRTVTLPLLTGNDTFVFASFAATLTNKTLTSAVLNTGVSGSAVLDQDDMSGNSATQLATQQSIKAYVDAQVATEDTLAELNDTTISGPASNDVLQYSGSAWVDRTYAEAGLASLTGSETLTNKTLSSPDINTPDLDGGTVDAVTSLTVANNVDIGAYTLRASGFLADGLTSGQVVYTGTDGVLSSEAALAYNATSNTLTATNIAGTLSTAAQGSVTSLGTLTSLIVQRGDDGIVIRANGSNGNMAGQFGATNTDEGYIDLADGGSTTVRIAANMNSYFNAVGKAVFIGDTANGKMTTGLTINMGGADNEALALKSSDVTHAVTGEAEADTYGSLKKTHTGDGGVQLSGYSSGTVGANIRAVQTTANTTKGTGASAALYMNSSLSSGTGTTAVSSNGNLGVMANDGTVRFIFDAEGSAHADVEWVAYAAYDDLALVVDMEQELLLHEDEAQTQRRHMLEETGIIGRDSWHMEDGKPRAMIDMSRLSMLHHGALIQTAERIEALESQILALEGRP